MSKLRIQEVGITWLVCSDLKVINSILGLMAHAARTPCYACLWVRGHASDNFPKRTLQRIRDKNREWIESGGDPAKLKDYENCRNPPLPIFPEEGEVDSFISPVQLHAKLGVVNDCVDGMYEVYPEGKEWPEKLNICKAPYHGAKFEGRECDVLLNNIDTLREMVAADDFAPRSLRSSTAQRLQHPAEPFIELFQAIKDVKDRCFGHALRDGWEQSLDKFRIAHDATGTT